MRGGAKLISYLIGTVVLVLALATIVWWGSIREALMDPGVPYQTYTPPPAPDYSQAAAWALNEPAGEGAADIFFIHPTTFQGRQWNAPWDHAGADRRLKRLMLPNYAGPFDELGRVVAPYYRQASLYTQMTLRDDAREARAFAYGDVQRAFETYLADSDPARPLIIVGVEQGGLLAERLVREALSAHPQLRDRLAAVYLIEMPVPAERFESAVADPAPPLALCQRREDFGCVVAYLAAAPDDDYILRERLRHAPMWQGGRIVPLGDAPLACVNPLTGSLTDGAVDAQENLGAANASDLEWGEQPGFQSHQVGAQCADGVLQVTRPRSPGLRGRDGWADGQRVRAYNWFYADLAADAAARIEALAERPPQPDPEIEPAA
jgi:hypothetical protein